MKINLNNIDCVNFNATLKIYNTNTHNTQLTKESVKFLEKAFSFATKDDSGHMDILIFDRYNKRIASPDRILYTDGEYSDFVDTLIKNTSDNNVILNKLLTIFNGFKETAKFKEKVMTIFK